MQEPAAIILSMARFRPWKLLEILFNIPLFLWQLLFLIWTYLFDKLRRIMIRVITLEIIILTLIYGWNWFFLFLWLTAWILFSLIPGQVPLRIILIAARIMHVRLCLEKIPGTNRWKYISQSAPNAEMDEWSDDQLMGRHFVYMAPGFKPSEIFIRAMVKYAEEHVADRGARAYDYLQLISILLNSILFWWIPGLHGKEVIKFMNLPGFREVCSTLVAAILRYAEGIDIGLDPITSEKTLFQNLFCACRFFPGFDTAAIPPCLYLIEAFLKGTWILPERWGGPAHPFAGEKGILIINLHDKSKRKW